MARLSSQVQLAHAIDNCRLMPPHQVTGPTTPFTQRRQAITRNWFRLVPVRSPLLGESLLLSSPPGTKMFQFPGLPRQSYGFTLPSRDMTPGGFPHSDSRGSTSVGDSSRTIVASHVLLRLLAPRYPPKALCSLTTLALSFDLIHQRSFGLLQMSSALGPLFVSSGRIKPERHTDSSSVSRPGLRVVTRIQVAYLYPLA